MCNGISVIACFTVVYGPGNANISCSYADLLQSGQELGQKLTIGASNLTLFDVDPPLGTLAN